MLDGVVLVKLAEERFDVIDDASRREHVPRNFGEESMDIDLPLAVSKSNAGRPHNCCTHVQRASFDL